MSEKQFLNEVDLPRGIPRLCPFDKRLERGGRQLQKILFREWLRFCSLHPIISTIFRTVLRITLLLQHHRVVRERRVRSVLVLDDFLSFRFRRRRAQSAFHLHVQRFEPCVRHVLQPLRIVRHQSAVCVFHERLDRGRALLLCHRLASLASTVVSSLQEFHPIALSTQRNGMSVHLMRRIMRVLQRLQILRTVPCPHCSTQRLHVTRIGCFYRLRHEQFVRHGQHIAQSTRHRITLHLDRFKSCRFNLLFGVFILWRLSWIFHFIRN